MKNIKKENKMETIIIGKKIVINNKELPPCPGNGHNITTINGKVYIDGYEFKNGKWKKTLKALYHKWF